MNEFIEGNHTKQEELDYKKFTDFAEHYKVMFNKHKETEYGTPFDALSLTESGGTYAVEIKTRYGEYDDYYIEFEKFAKMRELWRNKGYLPVYINFVEKNGTDKNVYLWKLNEVQNVKPYLNVQIHPKKGEAYEGDRMGLYPNEAYKFTWNESKGKYDITKPTAPLHKTDKMPVYNDTSILNNPITKYNYYKI